MLPQHGGVPNFRLRISGPILAFLVIVLLCGSLLALSFHLNAEPGDMAADGRAKLTLVATLMISFFLLLVGTNRWWHPNLWKYENSQKKHRGRIRRRRRHHRHRH